MKFASPRFGLTKGRSRGGVRSQSSFTSSSASISPEWSASYRVKRISSFSSKLGSRGSSGSIFAPFSFLRSLRDELRSESRCFAKPLVRCAFLWVNQLVRIGREIMIKPCTRRDNLI